MNTIRKMSAKALSLVLVLSLLLSTLGIGTWQASAEAVVPTTLVRQNLAKWKNYVYGDSQGTLYRTGCGMFAIVNSVGYLTGNTLDVTEVAAWGHSIGGYNPGNTHDGTYRMTIYPRLQAKYGKRYGFTVDCGPGNEGYWAGSSSSTLKNHLKNGGVAIGHVPGHFIAIVGYDPNTNYFHVYDSYPTSARGTGNGDCWVTQSHLATGKLKLDWFCLLSSTGTVINNHAVSQGYTVTFDSRGGSAVATQTVKEGEYATAPSTPTRDGYEFVGWYDEDGYEFLFDTTAIWANRNIHAEWRAVEWPQATDYMPTQLNTVVEDYTYEGESYVWPYFNHYTGAVTMYKGGADHGWPSMLATYNTSVDLSKYAYLNISVMSSARFNAQILFRDANAQTHTVKLSQIVNGTEDDFEVGNQMICANVGNYLYSGRYANMPSSGVVNIEAIRFYIVGYENEYVSLNAVQFTGEQTHVNLMSPDTLEQEAIAGTTGSYTYENGTLTVEGTGGYRVNFYPNVTVAPNDLPHWIVSAGASTYFDVSMVVSTSEGDRTVSLVGDYYNYFGYDSYPELGLEAGQFSKAFNLLGMYNWHNILPADGLSVIRKVTVELRGNGGISLYAFQMGNVPLERFFTDTVVKSDSWAGNISVENDDYVLNTDTDVLVTTKAGLTAAETKDSMNNGQYVRFFRDNVEITDTSLVGTGVTVRIMNGDTLLAEYLMALCGDMNGSGTCNTADVRRLLVILAESGEMSVATEIAADMDSDGVISALDVRLMLLALLV